MAQKINRSDARRKNDYFDRSVFPEILLERKASQNINRNSQKLRELSAKVFSARASFASKFSLVYEE